LLMFSHWLVLFLFHLIFVILLYFLIFMVNFTYNGGTAFFSTPLFSKVVCRFFYAYGGGVVEAHGQPLTCFLFSKIPQNPLYATMLKLKHTDLLLFYFSK
jgi:hypothetical protein